MAQAPSVPGRRDSFETRGDYLVCTFLSRAGGRGDRKIPGVPAALNPGSNRARECGLLYAAELPTRKTMAAMKVEATASPGTRPAYPTFAEAARVWLKIALLSFGGPAAQIALMHRVLVEEKRWISDRRFLHALNYCMLLPGPEATQLATYIGWLLHKTRGGLAAGLLFILPGIVALMVLSWIYVLYGQVELVSALFFGLKAAILAVVLEAVLRIGRRALKNPALVMLAACAFAALFFFMVRSRRWSSPPAQSAFLAQKRAGTHLTST